MEDQNTKVTLTKPKSIWNRKVTLELKPLFKALGKMATHATTLKFEELGNDTVEAAVSLGLETPIEELGYALVSNALLDALNSLSRESTSHFDASSSPDCSVSEELEKKLIGTAISFNDKFFDAPADQPFIKDVTEAYSNWLCNNGVSPWNSQSIAARLPAYFVNSLSSEWRKNSSIYKRLLDLKDTPFKKAEAALLGWNAYFSYLQKRISENIFDEPFSLAQLYIPLNAYYIERVEKSERNSPEFRTKDRKVCVCLEDELVYWLKSQDSSDALRVISGGPGSGKSSFTRVFCAEIAKRGIAKPVYIPLHLIDPTRDVSSEVEKFVRDEALLGFNPIDPDRQEKGILLVFDGLDELASMGKAAAQVARDFIQAVEKMIERRNLGPYPVNVIISGRELIVQENETEFRRPRQVLNILPYLITEDKQSYTDGKKILEVDLRQLWWRKYGELVGQQFTEIPKQLQLPEIDEITAQPLLNYLVALSYRRGKIDFDRTLNLNTVYADLVAAVHERGYEKTRTYRPISHINLRDFIRILEEIGLAAWHGSDGRSTSVQDILFHCQQSGLKGLLDSFTEGAQAGTTKLLAAFFFRRGNETAGNDATFVFTHKSFGEYLTAMRLVRGLDRIIAERSRRKANMDEGFDINDALIHWMKLTGPAGMTEYVQRFLGREVARRPTEELETWQAILTELMTHVIEHLMPMEKIGNLSHSAASRQEINSSTSLLIALNAVSRALRKVAKPNFASEVSFGSFLRRMCPQRSGAKSPLLFSCLSFLDLSEQCLDMVDLYGANLQYTLWRGTRARFGIFDRTDLSNADFTGAKLSWSRFEQAELLSASFTEATLAEAKFGSTAILRRVNFSRARLQNADFANAELVQCTFDEANISDSNINLTRRILDCTIDGAIVRKNEKQLLQWAERTRKTGGLTGELNPLEANDSKLYLNL